MRRPAGDRPGATGPVRLSTVAAMDSRFRRREIAVDQVRLSWLDNDGGGPVVVALHGLAGAGDEFIATAAAVGGAYRFVLPDLRGHGHSTRRPADVSREGDHRGWRRPGDSAGSA